jgi:hypothetical protein
MWTGSDDALTRVLESMDAQTFEEVARQNADRMPAVLRPKTIAAMWKFIKSTTDHPARMRTALDLIELGETGLDGVVKDAMVAIPAGDLRSLGSHNVQTALEHLRLTDPAWTSEWVAIQIAEGVLYRHENWLRFATAIPDVLMERYLLRVETEDLKSVGFERMIAVIAACSNPGLAARVFGKLRELHRVVDAEPGHQHEIERQVICQLEAAFRSLPDDVAAAGILASVTSGDPVDVKVAADLLNRIGRSDVEPMHISDDELKVRLRAYLKSNVVLVLSQDDFNGEEKANLASSIAQVGLPEDMTDLVTLIRADIERVRRGRTARAAGDRGPLGNGGSWNNAFRHIAAVMHLDPIGAEQVLIDLLPEPEYRTGVATAMARDFMQKPVRSVDRTRFFESLWAAREGRTRTAGDNRRRTRFVVALETEIKRLRKQIQDGKLASGLKELAKELAAIDGGGSAAAVLDAIVLPGQWDEHTRLDACELLLLAGVVLPATSAFALVDSVLERTENWMQESDRYLLLRILALCPYIDDPVAGIAKMRDVLGMRKFQGYDLREIITALGECRSDAAFDLMRELASNAQTFEQCEESFINAFAALDTPRARELLLGFIDPGSRDIALTSRTHCENVLVARLAELARRMPEGAARMREMCEVDLPELNRHVLSKVMERVGSPEALAANLDLIDDARPSPVPQGIWDQLRSSFVERRPFEQSPNAYTEHARASNELRILLFRMVNGDEKRRKSAFMLLGQIEEWRLEHGRPTGEPRHPDLASGQSWPPKEPFVVPEGSSAAYT